MSLCIYIYAINEFIIFICVFFSLGVLFIRRVV